MVIIIIINAIFISKGLITEFFLFYGINQSLIIKQCQGHNAENTGERERKEKGINAKQFPNLLKYIFNCFIIIMLVCSKTTIKMKSTMTFKIRAVHQIWTILLTISDTLASTN